MNTRALPTHQGHALRCIETQTVTVSAEVSADGTVIVYDTGDAEGNGDYHAWECLSCDQPLSDEDVAKAEMDYA